MSNQFNFDDGNDPSPTRPSYKARNNSNGGMWMAVMVFGLLLTALIGGYYFVNRDIFVGKQAEDNQSVRTQKGKTSPNAIAREEVGRKTRAVNIRSDYDACQLGDLVCVRGEVIGEASSDPEYRTTVLRRFTVVMEHYNDREIRQGVPVYDSLMTIKCLDTPAPKVPAAAMLNGETVITGTVVGKPYPNAPAGSFRMLLLENCTFRKP